MRWGNQNSQESKVSEVCQGVTSHLGSPDQQKGQRITRLALLGYYIYPTPSPSFKCLQEPREQWRRLVLLQEWLRTCSCYRKKNYILFLFKIILTSSTLLNNSFLFFHYFKNDFPSKGWDFLNFLLLLWFGFLKPVKLTLKKYSLLGKMNEENLINMIA